MATFGDALRGLASVLSPAEQQAAVREEEQKRGTQNQVGMLLLQQQMQEQSPEYKMKQLAMQRELGWQQAARAAQGDPVKLTAAAAEYKPELAVNLINAQEARAARMQQAADTLEARKLQMQNTHEIALQRLTDSKERQAEIERHNKATELLTAQGNALRGDLAKSAQDLKAMQFAVKADKDLMTNVQKLGGALEKANLPEADSVLGAVEKALENKELASYLSGPKSMLPDLAVPADIRNGRQAFQSLFNITLKNRSGAAVTIPEYERLKSEFGTGAFKTPKQLQDAVVRVREVLNKHYASVSAGFGKDALDAYNENIRGFGGRVVIGGGGKEDPLGIR